MQRLTRRFKPASALWRVMALCVGALAGAVAAVVAALVAVVFAATMVMAAFMASILLALAATAANARRQMRAPAADPDVIEARNVGGHSWIAYGWDGRR